VNKNNSQDGLTHVTNSVKVTSNTNSILMCVPYRHNLSELSCVNSEVNLQEKVSETYEAL
jgi:hypothetical protein